MAQSESLDLVVGGAEANVAAGLAALGHETAMLTRLPASPLGDKARAALGAAGIDTRPCGPRRGAHGALFPGKRRGPAPFGDHL
jgi:2-dehydro-3-deoxygluconokinase